jgi:hypothetical protein
MQTNNKLEVFSAFRTGIFLYIALSELFFVVSNILQNYFIANDYSFLEIIVYAELITVVIMFFVLYKIHGWLWFVILKRAISLFELFTYSVILIALVFVYNHFYSYFNAFLFSEMSNQKMDDFYAYLCFTNELYALTNFFAYLKFAVFGIVFSFKPKKSIMNEISKMDNG